MEPAKQTNKFFGLWKTIALPGMWNGNDNPRYFFIALALIITTGVGLLSYIWQLPEPQAGAFQILSKKPEPKFYSPLTGNLVADENVTKQQVTAIMLENSPDARPQSGLKDAGVVFEAVAEGGITRFIALYQESKPGLIGPVRSVRPYYVEWAAAFDPSVAHIGGSARALQMIRGGEYGHDIDQFFNAGAYWRAADRYAPHNVYTNFERLDALNVSKGFVSSTFTPWPRVDEKKVPAPDANTITIDVSSGSYNVSYAYIPETNTYRRSQGGQVHTDREKGDITPNVVIALKVPVTNGFEDGNREQITTTGSGEAYIFQNGTVIGATWSRGAPKEQLVFTGPDGKPVALNRGQTWVTALSNTRGVAWQ